MFHFNQEPDPASVLPHAFMSGISIGMALKMLVRMHASSHGAETGLISHALCCTDSHSRVARCEFEMNSSKLEMAFSGADSLLAAKIACGIRVALVVAETLNPFDVCVQFPNYCHMKSLE